MEARDTHVPLSLGRDGPYSPGRVFLTGPTVGGSGHRALVEPVNWDDEMVARFQGTREGQLDFLCEDHGPKCDWLLNFEVRSRGFMHWYNKFISG